MRFAHIAAARSLLKTQAVLFLFKQGLPGSNCHTSGRQRDSEIGCFCVCAPILQRLAG
jgi:hypothetical protein